MTGKLYIWTGLPCLPPGSIVHLCCSESYLYRGIMYLRYRHPPSRIPTSRSAAWIGYYVSLKPTMRSRDITGLFKGIAANQRLPIFGLRTQSPRRKIARVKRFSRDVDTNLFQSPPPWDTHKFCFRYSYVESAMSSPGCTTLRSHRASCRQAPSLNFRVYHHENLVTNWVSAMADWTDWRYGTYRIVNTDATGDSPMYVFYICPASLDWGCFR